MINYEQFMNLIPKETAEFVKMFLKIYHYYVYSCDSIFYIENDVIIENDDSKIFIILLLTKFKFDVNDVTRVFLEQNNMKKISELDNIKNMNYDTYKIFEEEIFNQVASFLCCFKFVENYIFLTPEVIISRYYNERKNYFSFMNNIDDLFSSAVSSVSNVFSDFICMADELKNKKQKEIEKEFYKDFSYELITYLEKAACIFKYLEVNKNENIYNSKVISTVDDMVISSLLIAVGIKNTKISDFFDEMGLTKKIIEKVFKVSYTENFEELAFPVATIIYYFKKYLDDGKNKDISKKDLSIQKIISNIFDHNFTNSRVLDVIFYESGLSINDFDNFEEKLKDFEKQYLIKREQRMFEEFYDGLSKEVIDFINFVSKVHIIIKKFFDEKKCNSKYIDNEKDICNFAFFISAYFFKNNFITYFKENKISYEKVMKYLNINLKKEDIEMLKPDIVLIKQYRNIIFGVTSNRKKINIDTVIGGIGNVSYSGSNCIQNFIKDINPNLRISDDLNELVDKYNSNKEVQRRYKLEQKFFGNMSKDTVRFIKEASYVFKQLLSKHNTNQFSDDDITEISIYLTSIIYYKGDDVDFLKSLTSGTIYDLLGISEHPDFIDEIDIDIIYKYFGKYVFGIKNKNKSKSEITIKDIYLNIFDKKVNDSIALHKFLDDVNFKFDLYENYDENEAKFIEEKNISLIKSRMYSECYHYFNNLTKVYPVLCNLFNNGSINNKNNILDSAKLLTLFLEKNYSLNCNSELEKRLILLEKRGITLDSYLQYLNISKDDFYKYENENNNYKIIDEKFYEISDYQLLNIINHLFTKNDTGYKFEDYIKSLNQDSDVIYQEIDKGEKIIVPLSIDDQIEHFNNLPISKLDYNITTISSFGRELSEHSFVIADEYLKIAQMYSNENDVIYNIQEELNKLEPKNEFKLFFRKKVSATQKIEQNKIILNNLNKFLEQKEINIYEQIEHFSYLKKLIAVYIYRLSEYIKELESTIINFEQNHFNNTLENFDAEVIKQIFDEKLYDFKKSLIISTQQYQKINLLLSTHALTLSKISTYRNTIIPNLYMEISIKDGILSEQESIESLNKINNLLDNMIKTNNQLLAKNNFKNNNLSSDLNLEFDEQFDESIKKILLNENLIETKGNQKKLIK